MLDIEIEVDPSAYNKLLNRLMKLWPDVEIQTLPPKLRFSLIPSRGIDPELSDLEKVLKKTDEEDSNGQGLALTVETPDSAKNDIKSFRTAGRFLLMSPDSPEPIISPPETITLLLDSGRAFGSGRHPSTGLMLDALEDYYSPSPVRLDAPKARVLDAGTGTGILAMAAARLGVGPILAVDTSDHAIQTARFNIAANRLIDRITVTQTPLKSLEGRFDLILANLTSAVLTRSVAVLIKLLERGGCLLASGFTDDQAPNVIRALVRTGGQVSKSYTRHGWTAVWLTGPDR